MAWNDEVVMRKNVCTFVAPSGFEPETKVPETSVLPLHHGKLGTSSDKFSDQSLTFDTN